jgi:hypothetical protein
MAAMDQKPELSLPAVPPPPNGERVEIRARGLAGLIAGQESAVVYHRSERLTAMVIVLNGRVVDAVADTNGEVVKGVDVLDELGEVPVAELQVIGVAPRVARALPVYWRAPGATKELVTTLVQPGRRGAILASSPTRGTGIVVFDERGIVASFVNGEVREEAIDELLDDPATVIAPRVEARPGGRLMDLHPAEVEEEPELHAPAAAEVAARPAPAAGVPDSPPPSAFDAPAPGPDRYAGFAGAPAAGYPAAPDPPGYAPPGEFHPPAAGPGSPFGGPGDPFSGWGPSGFAGTGAGAPAPAPYGTPAGEAELEQRRQAIVDLLQRELGRHSESVSAPFRTAPTVDALEGAAQGLAGETVRLVSSNRMQNLSLQATAIARGEQPPQ